MTYVGTAIAHLNLITQIKLDLATQSRRAGKKKAGAIKRSAAVADR